MQKAECGLLGAGQARPIRARRFQQTEGAVDVGRYKRTWAEDGTVDMAFGRKMHNRARLMRCQQLCYLRRIADVAFDENMLSVLPDCQQIIKIAGIGELVKINDRVAIPCQPIENKI